MYSAGLNPPGIGGIYVLFFDTNPLRLLQVLCSENKKFRIFLKWNIQQRIDKQFDVLLFIKYQIFSKIEEVFWTIETFLIPAIDNWIFVIFIRYRALYTISCIMYIDLKFVMKFISSVLEILKGAFDSKLTFESHLPRSGRYRSSSKVNLMTSIMS